MPLLQVINYSKLFHIDHLGREIPVFEHLNFTLDEGQFLLVSGPNGIGKSTLLRCLYRTYLPTGGQALYRSRHGVIDLARAADIDAAKSGGIAPLHRFGAKLNCNVHVHAVAIDGVHAATTGVPACEPSGLAV